MPDGDVEVTLYRVTRIETRVLRGGLKSRPTLWRLLRITCADGHTYEIECQALNAHEEYVLITDRDGRATKLAQEG